MPCIICIYCTIVSAPIHKLKYWMGDPSLWALQAQGLTHTSPLASASSWLAAAPASAPTVRLSSETSGKLGRKVLLTVRGDSNWVQPRVRLQVDPTARYTIEFRVVDPSTHRHWFARSVYIAGYILILYYTVTRYTKVHTCYTCVHYILYYINMCIMCIIMCTRLVIILY